MKEVDLMLPSIYGRVISDRNTLKIKRYNIRYMLDMLKKTEVLRRSHRAAIIGSFFVFVIAGVFILGQKEIMAARCGSNCPPPPPHPVASSSPIYFRYDGTGNDHAGASVAVGDVNGDGIADLLIGADGGALGGNTQAGAYVLVLDGASHFQKTLYKISGPEADAFGDRVVVGDVNGDGKGDIIVGAPNGNAGVGYVNIYDGATGALLRTLNGVDNGASGGAHFGHSLAFANIAGTPVLLVGAPAPGAQTASNSYADLFNAATGQVIYEWVAPVKQAERGDGVAFADVKGDGTPDIILGDGSGQTGGKTNGYGDIYVYDGSNYSKVLDIFFSNGSGKAKAEDNFGFSVAACDVNGDVRPDVIGGAYRGDTLGLTNNGYVLVYSGADASLLDQFNGTYGQGLMTNGGEFGYSVACGDINGDNKSDVIVGERWSDGGHVYAYDGETGALLFVENPLADQNYDWLGYAVTTGLIQNNGKVNIVAGAPQGDSRASSQGGYVVVYEN
jgi:hypothetical protein